MSSETVDVLAIQRCPKCGGDVEHGYGLAQGPGIGSYVYCVGSPLPDPQVWRPRFVVLSPGKALERAEPVAVIDVPLDLPKPGEGCGYSLKVEDDGR